jgi:CheY-like chemotaxis protein
MFDSAHAFTWQNHFRLAKKSASVYAAEPKAPRVGLPSEASHESEQDRPMDHVPAVSACGEVLKATSGPACAAPRTTKGTASDSGQPPTQNKKQLKRNSSANRVLLLGRIQELALYRAEVLRDRGFEVRASTDKDQAIQLIRGKDFDAVVLSYTLSSETVEELAEEIRESCPECPLVVIAQTGRFDRKIAPDAVALADDGPQALVSALRRVLQLH